MGDELWRRGALELAGMIAAREVSSVEVVSAHLQRIDEVNPALNAIVRRLDVEALAAAEAADRAVAAGDPLGLFHGVPMTVKENIDVAGTPTTSSLVVFADAFVGTDAPAVERMRAAGAIPIGRTNLPDLGLRVATESTLHGITKNPWNPLLTAGGSSGGEGSALASGMSPIGLGNDVGGSLRNPAHCCGIASIKPSTGVIPAASEVPPPDPSLMFQLMAVEGVMARRVADVRAGLLAVAGPHVRDPLALLVPFAEAATDRPFRVAVCADPPGGTTDAGIVDAIRHAADALADAGCDVVDAVPESYERALDLWRNLINVDVREQLPLLEQVLGPDALTFIRYAEEVTPALSLAEFSAGLIERLAVEKVFHRFLFPAAGGFDVLLTPTWAHQAFAHGADVASLEGGLATIDTMRPVLPANLLGLPAAIAPAGLADGMPVGAQFIARRFGDLVALHAAQLLEDALGTLTPIDPRH
jgi:amidase